MKFRDKLRNSTARFMYGRYGADEFSRFLLIAAFVLLLVSMFTGNVVHIVFWLAAVAALVWAYIRILSKRYEPRRRENARYLTCKRAVSRWFDSLKQRWLQRREYRFFRCPSCHALLRVPKGKGRIQLTCRKCGTRFERKS